jgi:hypothetical protein
MILKSMMQVLVHDILRFQDAPDSQRSIVVLENSSSVNIKAS